MAYIEPDFQVETSPDSFIITPQSNDDGNVEDFMHVDNLDESKTPYIGSKKVKRDRMCLARINDAACMWLYSDGTIKIGA